MSGAMIALLAGADASAGIILTGSTYYTSGSGGGQTTTVRVSSDGYVYSGSNGSFSQQYQWKQNGNTAASYDIYATLTGSASGTSGSWLSLGTTRDWSVTDIWDDLVTEDGTATLQIRDAATLSVLATAEFGLSAYRF